MPVALKVRNFKVTSQFVTFNELRWEIEPTQEDVLDYTFQVLRSEGSAGPWDEMSGEFEDRFFFVDNQINNTNKWRLYNYVLRVKHKLSGDTILIGPVAHDAEPDLIAIEIRKHMQLLFREFAGRRCWVLQRRTFGQRCSCFNKILYRKMKSGCRTCYDTGFVRGYYAPIETFIQIDPSSNNNQPSGVGNLQADNTTARLGYFPQLKPDDLIIEAENERWRVTKSNATQKLRAALHQEIELFQLARSDVEFLINLDFGTGTVTTAFGTEIKKVELSDLPFAGERNFNNPQNLEAAKDVEYPGNYKQYGNYSFKLKP